MIANYFQKSKEYFRIRKSIVLDNNPETTNKKTKKRISKLSEFEHFSLFCEVFIEKPLFPFTKEHLRVAFQNQFMCEMSDIDGIFWGQQYTYPIEIKEKTAANDSKLGDYFGLDVGPFVKLAFYAAKKGNLHSLFFVREINNTIDRELVNWWFIAFDKLAQYASWVPMGGGINMQGGGSTVVKIPKSEFSQVSLENLNLL